MKEQDNLVYYNKEKNQFYTIVWDDTGNGEFPIRHYINSGQIEPQVKMIVCSICGNKRCPKATDHNLDCTNSNESRQQESRY